MATLDIFNSNAFSLVSLTDRINRQPYVPSKISRLNIFEEKGVNTTIISVEEKSGLLSLIPTTPRGGPGYENQHIKHKLRNFNVPHLELSDTVMADEIQNVRAFGSENELVGVQAIVDDRLMEMNPKHDATLEYGRLGALKGLITDADGSTVLYNLFTEFGFSQSTVDFVLGTTTTSMIAKIMVVAGLIEDALGMAIYDHIHVLCGKTWWSKFITHPLITTAYQYYAATGQSLNANPLRDDMRYSGFMFGDMIFEQYRGNVGGIQFVADSEAYAFPVGVPGLYKTYFAPADWEDTVNTIGLPRYAEQAPIPGLPRKGRRITTQSNPLSLCLRPDTLIKLTTSN